MPLFIALVLLLWPATTAAQPAAQPARAAVIAAAIDIVQKARYCTFITIDQQGQPQARIVDPLAPDAGFTVWIATNPLTRKVEQVRSNPRVTLSRRRPRQRCRDDQDRSGAPGGGQRIAWDAWRPEDLAAAGDRLPVEVD
jgi:hypothetical protein